MFSWNFLADSIESDTLLLDCRSEEQYARSSLRGAYGGAFVKKPYGSGPQSQEKLSGYLAAIVELAAERPVVTFDEGQGMYACRMAWLLLSAGLKQVRVYSRKFSDFTDEELEPGPQQISASPVKAIKLEGIVGITDVQKGLTRVQILDVRTPEEYDGVLPRMVNPEPGTLCGRIPGSMHWDWRVLYGPEGRLKPKTEIVRHLRQIGLIQERPTYIYDYNGARSCSTALVLTGCGYRQVNVYLGSWMEWRKSKLPKQSESIWYG